MEREYVGIDLHRYRLVIVRMGEDGKQRSSVVDNDPGEFAAAVMAAPVGSDVVNGIVHFGRRTAQPVIAAKDGDTGTKQVFHAGDILVRRGAASVRANSGDVRGLLTSSVVNEARVRAVNELWTCLVEQRRLLGGAEVLFDILCDREYPDVVKKPDLRSAFSGMTGAKHISQLDSLHLRANLARPHLPQSLYIRYGQCSAVVGGPENR